MRHALGIILLFFVGSVLAGPVKWTLQNVTFSDGATASGFFVLDAETQVFSKIDIDVAGGTFLPDAHYDTAGLAFGGTPVLVVTGDHDSTLLLVFAEGLAHATLVTLQDDLLPGTFEEYWPGKFSFESHQYIGDYTQTENLNPLISGSVVGANLVLTPTAFITFDPGSYQCDSRPGTETCNIIHSEGYDLETEVLFEVKGVGELVWKPYDSAEVRASDGSGLWLHSIELLHPSTIGYLITGNLVGGGSIQQVVNTGFGKQKVRFDSNWQNLESFVINSDEGFHSIIDNIALSPMPISAVIDVIGTVHPHHIGQGGLPDDTVSVTVIGSSTLLGDPQDLDVSLIDPASVRFGPSAAMIAPASTPDLNYNHNNDGSPDAKFEFMMRDTGFPFTPGSGYPCSASPAEFIGELTTGEQFLGVDTIVNTACDATCH